MKKTIDLSNYLNYLFGVPIEHYYVCASQENMTFIDQGRFHFSQNYGNSQFLSYYQGKALQCS